MRATALAAITAAALTGLSLTGCTTSSSHASRKPPAATTAPAAATTTAAAQVPTPAQVQALATDLSSGDAARVAAAIGSPPGQPVSPDLTRQLASAAPIVFSPNITAQGPGVTTTTATVGTGANQQTWDVRLVLIDGKWVLGTTTLRSKP